MGCFGCGWGLGVRGGRKSGGMGLGAGCVGLGRD